ncbi:MAG TPA: protein-disulfide reductase DsbD domain-containing protein [Pyrinomonadaceae bacterium]|nr:protein-disulfide reductase DsbD domain-containing protein [Pyrinomonadaceae bacterium]
MKKIEGLSVIGLLLIVLSSCSKSEPNQTTAPPAAPSPSAVRRIASIDVVKVSPEEVTISAGGSGVASVRVAIDKGYHVNANPPTFPYLKPTELIFKATPSISISSVKYPGATTRKFQFAEKPLAVYEGEAIIKVDLKVNKGTPQGKQNLSGTLRVQACDEEVCYAPGEREIVIPVNIK